MNTINRDGGSLIFKLSNLHKLLAVFVLGVVMSMVLAACGGGGTSSPSNGSSGSTNITGNLIDGYITNAKVCLDSNNNGKCDTTEPFATTAASGVFSISVPSGTTTTGKNLVAEISTSSTDTDGTITAGYTMLAPVPTSSTSTVVTPLTTLVALNPASGVAGVAAALGISEAAVTGDYIATPSKSTHNIAQYLAGVIATVQNVQSSVPPNNGSILTAVEAVATPAHISAAAVATTSADITTLVDAGKVVPGAPTIGTATGGNAQATVAFTAPSSVGGSSISGYTVTSSPGGLTANGMASPITVTGLTNNTAYTFKVHATNAAGNSIESAASNSVTPAGSTVTPTAPTTAAAAPAHAIVQSVFTTVAADIVGTNLCPDWGQATQCTLSTIGGRESEEYSALTFEGIGLAAPTDFSAATNVHFDVWTPNVTSLGFNLINSAAATGGVAVPFQVNSTLTTGIWNSVDIPLSSFTGVDLTKVDQFMFVGLTPATGGTIYVQNIYFWGTAAPATIPGVPTIGTATLGNASATVSFTAPSSNGGSVITGYTVTSSPAGGTDSNAATTALTHTITGLTNGTSYTFTVHATNSVGSSAESAASNAVIPAVPSGGATISTASSWTLGGATTDWNGATSSLVTSQPAGGSQSNAAMVSIAQGAQYDGVTFLTLANAEFCTTAHPTVAVEVYAPVAGKVIELKLEQDGDVTKNIEMRKMSLAGWNTYTFNCLTDSGSNSLVQPTAPYVEGTVYNKASMMFDFDIVAGASAAETWYFDTVTYTPTAATTYVPPPPFSAPTTAAAAPSHTVLFSVLTNSAADIAGTNFFPNWGQPTVYTATTAGGVETAEYSNLSYEGIQFYDAQNTANPPVSTVLNVSSATHVHMDVWSNMTSLGLNLINSSVATGAGAVQFQVNSTLTTGWNSVDIPLSSFTGVNMAKIDQFMFVGVTPASGGTIYIQNLYFW